MNQRKQPTHSATTAAPMKWCCTEQERAGARCTAWWDSMNLCIAARNHPYCFCVYGAHFMPPLPHGWAPHAGFTAAVQRLEQFDAALRCRGLHLFCAQCMCRLLLLWIWLGTGVYAVSSWFASTQTYLPIRQQMVSAADVSSRPPPPPPLREQPVVRTTVGFVSATFGITSHCALYKDPPDVRTTQGVVSATFAIFCCCSRNGGGGCRNQACARCHSGIQLLPFRLAQH